jgi:predicted dehydrogenase
LTAPGAVLGLGIVGTGNIAGQYAADIATHPGIRLVTATDLDAARASAFADRFGIAVAPSFAALLADPSVDIVVNLTIHHAHFEVTKRALEMGKHVYSEKPMALRRVEAMELAELAWARGVRLGCSPSTFLGEAQQTAAAIVHGGRLGPVRAIYADVNWGRIETWHPAPAPFYDVGVTVDVGLYPLTLITSILGPARSVRASGWQLMPDRTTLDGGRFRIGSPDLEVAMIELATGAVIRLTTSFYVGRPAKQRGSIEFHGDDASLYLESFERFDGAVQVGAFGGEYEDVPLVRPPYPGTAWARGVAEMADAIREGRPHRTSAEMAGHIVEILGGVAASRSSDGAVIPMTSTFEAPPLMGWARV